MSEKIVCVSIPRDMFKDILSGKRRLDSGILEDGELIDMQYIKHSYRIKDLIYLYFEVKNPNKYPQLNTFSYYKGEHVPLIVMGGCE